MMKKYACYTLMTVLGLCASTVMVASLTVPSHHAGKVITQQVKADAVSEGMHDVTADYLSNPSFEADAVNALTSVSNSSDGLRGYSLTAPTGWTVSHQDATPTVLIVTADCFTDNNFGKVSNLPDGSQAFYLRVGWSNASSRVRQTLKSLPKGNYLLRADVRTGYANSATSTFGLVAGNQSSSQSFVAGSQGFFESEAWTTTELKFSQSATANVEIGFDVTWVSGGSCIMIDNVRLYQLDDTYVEPSAPTEKDLKSPTEDVITADFVAEAQMKDDLLQMLTNFATYLKNDYQECAAPNSKNEACGCFRSNSTMQSNEDGVRSNADLSMICAFLAKYAKGKTTLPAGVSWEDIEGMAMKSLVFAYSTHKANKFKVTSDNRYWGSVSASDYVWESSLWAMSVAYSAFFQWDKLTDNQKTYIYNLLKSECNYELQRSIPTGYAGDTKAEENGWEADVLAVTLGLFPDDALAERWYARLREFAVNSYSQKDDAVDATVIDPDYDTKTVKDLFRGQNLYDDYTLQNHNYFHTSYQNVVIQELGEAALALKMFQLGLKGEEKWSTNALMHNNDHVMNDVLKWLALADGELAMPNGNDWSMFLYDQITSYTTNACFLGDADALLLENLAYKMIKARQTTTSDGSWLLRSDIGARRMGVEAHRVMMTWLMHEVMSTAKLEPTAWDAFSERYSTAKVFTTQNIVRASNQHRFTTFSWSGGLKSYTGYFAANSVDKNKIIIPYKANNTGNFLGWYQVSGKGTNATPVVSGIYDLRGNSYVMNGELSTNDATLNHRFAIYSTPGNAVIYLDHVRASAAATITKEYGGLMAISVDELTKTKRTLYYQEDDKVTYKQLDGSVFTKVGKGVAATNWVNVDNALGIVAHNDKSIAFGDKANVNSVNAARLCVAYHDKSRQVKAGENVDKRNVVYYSNVTADETRLLSEKTVSLLAQVPEGWNGIIAPDPDGTAYLLLSNFASDKKCELTGILLENGAPVFTELTTITSKGAHATFMADMNHSVGNTLLFALKPDLEVKAIQDAADSSRIFVQNVSGAKNMVTVSRGSKSDVFSMTAGEVVSVKWVGGEFVITRGEEFPGKKNDSLTEGYEEVTEQYLTNANFEDDETYGDATGNVTLGSVTYNPCYVNTVSAASSKWPNILPVKGWKAGNGLTSTSGSNYCRMYSMPYSTTMYCVSPSSVGNYAAICGRPMADDSCGDRVLTVLNSWDAGQNAITQTVTLPAGRYRLLLDMKYECTNQTKNDGRTVQTSGNNTNTSLTGVKIGTVTDYRYASENYTWETLCYDFETDSRQDVTFSAGFRTSASVGAANNTLLYIDNLRLFRAIDTGIETRAVGVSQRQERVYDLTGRQVSPSRPGVYIVGNRKHVVR